MEEWSEGRGMMKLFFIRDRAAEAARAAGCWMLIGLEVLLEDG